MEIVHSYVYSGYDLVVMIPRCGLLVEFRGSLRSIRGTHTACEPFTLIFHFVHLFSHSQVPQYSVAAAIG